MSRSINFLYKYRLFEIALKYLFCARINTNEKLFIGNFKLWGGGGWQHSIHYFNIKIINAIYEVCHLNNKNIFISLKEISETRLWELIDRGRGCGLLVFLLCIGITLSVVSNWNFAWVIQNIQWKTSEY